MTTMEAKPVNPLKDAERLIANNQVAQQQDDIEWQDRTRAIYANILLRMLQRTSLESDGEELAAIIADLDFPAVDSLAKAKKDAETLSTLLEMCALDDQKHQARELDKKARESFRDWQQELKAENERREKVRRRAESHFTRCSQALATIEQKFRSAAHLFPVNPPEGQPLRPFGYTKQEPAEPSATAE